MNPKTNKESSPVQTSLTDLQEENKALQEELRRAKTNYLKRIRETTTKGETSLNQQIKGLLAQFDRENTVFYDKVRLFKKEDAAIKRERQQIEESQSHIQTLETRLSEQ
ncbi:unnamed protein product, partial [marine sediment metagenome]